jgi:hypothetical protein
LHTKGEKKNWKPWIHLSSFKKKKKEEEEETKTKLIVHILLHGCVSVTHQSHMGKMNNPYRVGRL